MRARGVYVEQGGTLQAVPAPRFDGAAYAPGEACAPGAHTPQVLAQLAAQGAGGVWRK
jgi:alpha-methylacyl-CoA racemase